MNEGPRVLLPQHSFATPVKPISPNNFDTPVAMSEDGIDKFLSA